MPTLATTADRDLDTYRRDGVVHIPAFLDEATLIRPLQEQIREVIELARHEAGLGPAGGEEFDAGLRGLVAHDRRRAGQVYDAIRKLPAFFAVATAPPVWELVSRLMGTDLPGFYAQGSGIRMDHPGEDDYLSPWHQEYLTHLGSLDMLTVWSPLVPVDQRVGSVILCPESYRDGVMPIHLDDPLNRDRNGAKAAEIVDVERYVEKYPPTSVDTVPGDVVVLHGLTLHRSRPNRSDRTRWSMQLRYFNFRDATGRRIGWTGGMLAGVDLRDVHPDAVLEREGDER